MTDIGPTENDRGASWRISQGYHVLVEVDPDAREGVCSVCGPVKIRKHTNSGWRCNKAGQQWNTNAAYRQFRGDSCERCDFEPEHPSQLDVHHIDEDRTNNSPENLQTLCANCHRLTKVKEVGYVFSI